MRQCIQNNFNTIYLHDVNHNLVVS